MTIKARNEFDFVTKVLDACRFGVFQKAFCSGECSVYNL